MTNICTDDIAASREYYTRLFDLEVNYDSDWFIHLVSKDRQLEMGLISKTSEIVPDEAKDHPSGFYITFVVADADEVFEIAKKEGLEVLQEPSDTFYGQRRLLLKDPNGIIIDVSSPILN